MDFQLSSLQVNFISKFTFSDLLMMRCVLRTTSIMFTGEIRGQKSNGLISALCKLKGVLEEKESPLLNT